MADYIEKITAMEEELEKVNELFAVEKDGIEKFQANLPETEMELEVSQKDLDITKVLLAEEEDVASTLESSEEKPHGTATKLLTTVKETTGDVSSLHAKLDGKKAVEQHNVEAQKTLMDQMNILADEIQNSVEKNYQKQQELLNSYTTSVYDLLSDSVSASGAAIAAIDAAFTSVKEMFSTEVSLTAEKMLNQDTLTSKNKNVLQKMIEEHACRLDKALSSVTPVVQHVQSVNSQLQELFQKNSSEMSTAQLMHDYQTQQNVSQILEKGGT